MPKSLEMHYITYALHYKNVLECGISQISIQNVSNLNVTKKVSKRKYCLQLHCLFHPSDSTHFFFKKHKNMPQEMVKNLIKLIQYFIFLSDVTCLQTFFFNFCTLIKQNY